MSGERHARLQIEISRKGRLSKEETSSPKGGGLPTNLIHYEDERGGKKRRKGKALKNRRIRRGAVEERKQANEEDRTGQNSFSLGEKRPGESRQPSCRKKR